MEAAVLVAKCPKHKLLYGIRTQKMNDGDWWRTWAFPIDEKRARREGYDQTIVQGSLNCTEDYPGCPYCKKTGFYECGSCHKIVCYSGESQVVCPWCGSLCENFIDTDSFNFSGGDV